MLRSSRYRDRMSLTLLLLLFVIISILAIGPNRGLASDLTWHTHYGQAIQEATESGRCVLICFHQADDRDPVDKIDELATEHSGLQEQLAEMVLLQADLDATATYEGETTRLLDHASFREMRGKPGIAVIDYRDVESKYFGRVVTIYPLTSKRRISDESLGAILGLPDGTLTQRSLVLAVRMHHERPRSAEASWHPTLAAETESHSKHQARIRSQGHHNWERRFHRINGRLGSGLLAQEVCAESWPGQGLMEAAEECVNSWRQSSGHWRAVSGRQQLFAYDMKRGANGIWYATGIFAR